MKQIIQYILVFFAFVPLMAQENGKLDITTLNWEELKIDSLYILRWFPFRLTIPCMNIV